MKPHKWILTGWCLLLYVVAPSVFAQTAEPQTFHRVVVRQTGNVTQFLDMDDDGTLTFVTELEGVVLWYAAGFKWTIEATTDISPSPNGQHVAFTALSLENKAMLFVVSLNPLRVKQYIAPGIASLQWSPTSDALLLSRPNVLLGSDKPSLRDGDSYVFDLATESFTLVAETDDTMLVSYSNWLPDGQSIVYVARSRSGSPDELIVRDLFKVGRDGTVRQRLTDLKLQAPQIIDFTQPANRNPCYINQFKWSSNGRLYYFLNCLAFNEANLPSLFSVDMAGNNRPEIDLVSLFLDEVDPVEGFGVVDFFPDTADGQLYMVINTPTHEMRVLRLNASSQIEVVARIANKDGYEATLSADGSRIAISTSRDVITGLNPLIAVYDLTTGQIETTILPLAEKDACRVQWQNGTVVLVDQVTQCIWNDSSFGRPVGIFAWDTAHNTVEDIKPEIGGDYSLIIPLPEVAPLSGG